MRFNRGDVIEIPFLLNGRSEVHPAVIISNSRVHEDGKYICVMITHSQGNSELSFPITNEMFNKPICDGTSNIQCHLVTYLAENHISNYKNTKMIRKYVDRLVSYIQTNALSIIDDEY